MAAREKETMGEKLQEILVSYKSVLGEVEPFSRGEGTRTSEKRLHLCYLENGAKVHLLLVKMRQ